MFSLTLDYDCQLFSFHMYIKILQPEDGVQIFMELVDIDVDSGPDLIDRFAINVTSQPNNISAREQHTGLFQLAEIEVSFSLACAENFCGLNCDVYSPDRCLCDREATQQLQHCRYLQTSCDFSDISISMMRNQLITQLVFGISFLLVFIKTAIIILFSVRRKLKKYSQFSYVKYIRRNSELQEPNPDRYSAINDTHVLPKAPHPPSPEPVHHDYDNDTISTHSDTDSSSIPYVPADVAMKAVKYTKNMSYNSMNESYGCDPCPAYGSGGNYEPVMLL